VLPDVRAILFVNRLICIDVFKVVVQEMLGFLLRKAADFL